MFSTHLKPNGITEKMRITEKALEASEQPLLLLKLEVLVSNLKVTGGSGTNILRSTGTRPLFLSASALSSNNVLVINMQTTRNNEYLSFENSGGTAIGSVVK